MKVAILTFSRTFNHGATLQCYALSKFVESLGHETIIINIPLINKSQGSKETRSIKSYFKKILRFTKRNIVKLIKSCFPKDPIYYQTPLSKVQQKVNEAADKENMRLFDLFRKEYFTNFTHEYINEDDFISDYPKADAYIVGSDQVWNIEITRSQYPIFFLSFVQQQAKKISYAASMGGNTNYKFSDEQFTKLKNLLSSFNAISVRDFTSKEILSKKFCINPIEVLDPTFLVPKQFYLDIAKKSNLNTSGHIYFFKFIINKHWIKVIDKLSENLGLPVRMDNNVIPTAKYEYKPICDVPDWLRLIQTSDFIITDSFHCMVFCILFKKEFIILPSYKGGEGRMLDLTRKLGLEDRYFKSPNDFLNDNRDWKREHIDYDNVYSKLEPLIKKSKDFILKNL